LLGKRELIQALWPSATVEENSLNQVVSQLRKALGESPSEHRYIVTSPGRGYRFVAAVRAGEGDQPAPPLVTLTSLETANTAPDSFFGYLKALALARQPSPQNLSSTIELLRQAVTDSPDFAKAHSLLAIQYTRAAMFAHDGGEMLDLARQETALALALDERNGETWGAAAVIDCLDGVWGRAEDRFRFALALNADPLTSGFRCAYLTMSVGQIARALQQAEYTLQIAPTHPLGVQMMSLIHMTLGNDLLAQRYAQLLGELGQSREVAPLADIIAVLELRAGQSGELEKLLKGPDNPPMRKRWMLWHTLQGDLDAAYAVGVESLDTYAREGSIGGAWGFLWFAEMRPFREDDRFRLFVRRLRFFEYWTDYGPPDGYSLVGERLVRLA
jgi:tetratricopeptide (TPR) repeat protein